MRLGVGRGFAQNHPTGEEQSKRILLTLSPGGLGKPWGGGFGATGRGGGPNDKDVLGQWRRRTGWGPGPGVGRTSGDTRPILPGAHHSDYLTGPSKQGCKVSKAEVILSECSQGNRGP